VDGLWATKSEGVGLIVRGINFQDFQPGELRKTIFPQDCVLAVQGHSIKVIDFGTNRKRVCDFLLVRHCTLVHILHRFGYIAGFLLRN